MNTKATEVSKRVRNASGKMCVPHTEYTLREYQLSTVLQF
jgi:hypothetical protein